MTSFNLKPQDVAKLIIPKIHAVGKEIKFFFSNWTLLYFNSLFFLLKTFFIWIWNFSSNAFAFSSGDSTKRFIINNCISIFFYKQNFMIFFSPPRSAKTAKSRSSSSKVKRISKPLGGGWDCRRCAKKVYHAEMQVNIGVSLKDCIIYLAGLLYFLRRYAHSLSRALIFMDI